VADFNKRITAYEEKIGQWADKKPWITADARKDVEDKIKESVEWLTNNLEKQGQTAVDEDPAFRVAELEGRLKRVELIFTRVSNTPKPKEAKKTKKMPKNIKIENMTFDGTQDINWEDFVHVNNGGDDSDSYEEDAQQQQQQ
jgi:hypothetical protein